MVCFFQNKSNSKISPDDTARTIAWLVSFSVLGKFWTIADIPGWVLFKRCYKRRLIRLAHQVQILTLRLKFILKNRTLSGTCVISRMSSRL